MKKVIQDLIHLGRDLKGDEAEHRRGDASYLRAYLAECPPEERQYLIMGFLSESLAKDRTARFTTNRADALERRLEQTKNLRQQLEDTVHRLDLGVTDLVHAIKDLESDDSR